MVAATPCSPAPWPTASGTSCAPPAPPSILASCAWPPWRTIWRCRRRRSPCCQRPWRAGSPTATCSSTPCPGSPFPLHHWTAPAERALYAAHLVAALPLPVAPNRPATQAFREHPLGRGEPLANVALVYGGATRIKGYVFESPRLPEIRGASGLLDRINRVDLPALFGARFDAPADAAAAARSRAWFAARGGAAPLEAPECVLYAGGNLLALAPASLGEALQAAIEAWYAMETLVGAERGGQPHL